ncbi:MAG: hypothetical protein ABSD52_06015 [Candidatus Cybelea sp.]
MLAGATTLGFPPPGAYNYTASMSGQPIGQWNVTVKRSDSATEIDENSWATVMGMTLSAKAMLALGLDLSPTSYTGNYRAAGQNVAVTVALTPASATITGTQSSSAHAVALVPDTHHFVVIEPGLLAGLFALPAQLALWNESTVTWLSPVTGSAQPLMKSAAAATARPSGVPAQDVELSLTGQTPATIWYDANSFIPDRIEIPSQNAVLTRVR